MKVNIIYPNLNPCGGGERLSIAVMQGMDNIGVEFDITTLERPNINRIKNSYGEIFGSVVQKASNVNILLPAFRRTSDYYERLVTKYDLTINTHSDAFPYYQSCFTKKNCISYCHFPTAKHQIEEQNEEYLKETRLYSFFKNPVLHSVTPNDNERYFQGLMDYYLKLMKNSTVITNSGFTKKAIYENLGIEAQVLPPPVDTESFRTRALISNKREDIVLVLCRIVPYKKIENAIAIARILKENNICKGMKILGNMYDDDYVTGNYYYDLLNMLKEFDLRDYVSIETRVPFESVIRTMRRAKVYLHTMYGEPFGISTVEAMSAGLVPIVPNVGGHTEFVPKKYQFDSAHKACDIISSVMELSSSERVRISDSVRKFSTSNFSQAIQRLVKKSIS